MDPSSRASQQTGDFGEDLVTYILIRHGYEVAVVDHVGADLIAQKGSKRYAVSVKARRYAPKSRENRALVIKTADLDLLKKFARRFDLRTLVAEVHCVHAENTIHVFMMTPACVRREFTKTKAGFRWSIKTPAQVSELKAKKGVSYTCLSEKESHVVLE